MGKLILGLVFLIVGLMGTSNAQNINPEMASKAIYEGYVLDNESLWRKGLSYWESLCDKSDDLELEIGQISARYGWIGYSLAKGKDQEVKKELSKTFEHAVNISKMYPENGELHAIIGGLYGMRMGLSPAKAIYLGPRSLNRMKKSRKYSPNHPIPWIEQGNAKYHSPPIAGGSTSEAILAFEKAKDLFDASPVLKANNWMYLHTLAWLGQSYAREGKKTEARKVYQSLIEYEPRLKWVTEELLPALEKS